MNHFHRYDEIIHLPHPVSQTHPRMAAWNERHSFHLSRRSQAMTMPCGRPPG